MKKEKKEPEYFYFPVPEGEENVDFESFTMRRLVKRDEREAAVWADSLRAEAGIGDENWQGMVQLQIEQKMLLAIGAIDGEEVHHPLIEAAGWSMQSWSFVQAAYNELNGADPKKLESFAKQRIRVSGPNGKPGLGASEAESAST